MRGEMAWQCTWEAEIGLHATNVLGQAGKGGGGLQNTIELRLMCIGDLPNPGYAVAPCRQTLEVRDMRQNMANTHHGSLSLDIVHILLHTAHSMCENT
mmetsp:Transcript_77413/g.129195  ORF Transcript_77413/g.129195 Transcript_77413/m.129195 type:complete len:98 (-) Transcript_77413:477-770(-)